MSERSVFEQIRDLLEEIETDSYTKGTSDWHHFKDRYEENVESLKELVGFL